MLQDHRRHARYALAASVVATDDRKRTVPVTILDIGDGGVGLRSEEELISGSALSFRLLLPGARRDIHIQARVLWTRKFGRIGCEFIRIPPVDVNILARMAEEQDASQETVGHNLRRTASSFFGSLRLAAASEQRHRVAH